MLPNEQSLRDEGRLLFVLLDSIHEAGLMRDSAWEYAWYSLRRAIIEADLFEDKASDLYELLRRIAGSGVLAGTWIGTRWSDVEQRVNNGDLLTADDPRV